jgi:hypothetical protein
MVSRYAKLFVMLTKMEDMARMMEIADFPNSEELVQTIRDYVSEFRPTLTEYTNLMDAGIPHPWFEMLENKITENYNALLGHMEENGLVEYMIL